MDLRNEDCIEGIKTLEDNSLDLIFCDLPYGCTDCTWDNKLDLNKLAEQLWRIAKDKCTIVFTCKMKFGYEILNAMGIKYFRYDMVWKKARPCGYLNSNRMPMVYHENILIFYKKCPADIYKKNKQRIHKIINTGATKKLYTNKVYGKINNIKKTTAGYYEPKLPSSVMDITHNNKKLLNSTQKPLELIEFFIKYYTEEGALVLDPTFGSGTTAVACKNNNRRFIGFELNTEQYNTAVARIKGFKDTAP